MIEHRIPNPAVPGSSLGAPAIFYHIIEYYASCGVEGSCERLYTKAIMLLSMTGRRPVSGLITLRFMRNKTNKVACVAHSLKQSRPLVGSGSVQNIAARFLISRLKIKKYVRNQGKEYI